MNAIQQLNPKSIDFFDECCAYEALWDEPKMTLPLMAERFKTRPGARPSDFISSQALQAYQNQLKELSQFNFKVLLHGEAEYPNQLRDAAYPVELLYYQGSLELIKTPLISVVGTHNPGLQGINLAVSMVKTLVAAGYTVVSGLEEGINTVVHQTAMKCGGNTIAFIGTSLSKVYPTANRDLQKKIAEKYLLITQAPFLKYAKQKFNQNKLFFHERNITMSALSLGTLIIEAGQTSNILIQARAALTQGRKLLIADYCFNNHNLTWPKKLAKEGAICVNNIDDIEKALKGTSL